MNSKGQIMEGMKFIVMIIVALLILGGLWAIWGNIGASFSGGYGSTDTACPDAENYPWSVEKDHKADPATTDYGVLVTYTNEMGEEFDNIIYDIYNIEATAELGHATACIWCDEFGTFSVDGVYAGKFKLETLKNVTTNIPYVGVGKKFTAKLPNDEIKYLKVKVSYKCGNPINAIVNDEGKVDWDTYPRKTNDAPSYLNCDAKKQGANKNFNQTWGPYSSLPKSIIKLGVRSGDCADDSSSSCNVRFYVSDELDGTYTNIWNYTNATEDYSYSDELDIYDYSDIDSGNFYLGVVANSCYVHSIVIKPQ